MQRRIREARRDALARSVGRAKGKRSLWSRLLRRGPPRSDGITAEEADFHRSGEDVWKALRF